MTQDVTATVLDNPAAPTITGFDVMSTTLRDRMLIITFTIPEGRADGSTGHRVSGRVVLPVETAVNMLGHVDALVKKAKAQGLLG